MLYDVSERRRGRPGPVGGLRHRASTEGPGAGAHPRRRADRLALRARRLRGRPAGCALPRDHRRRRRGAGAPADYVGDAATPTVPVVRVVASLRVSDHDSDADPYALAPRPPPLSPRPPASTAIDVALVLGSGWAPAADMLGRDRSPSGRSPTCPASPPRPWPVTAGRSARSGPASRRLLVFLGAPTSTRAAASTPVVHGVRTAAAAGLPDVVLTNGCGGLRPEPGRRARRC